MSTRSLTNIQDEQGRTIVTMYRQSDGYPSGHGQELADLLSGLILVNGISGGGPPKQANGMGCLAAQLVAHFKDGIGGIYLQVPRKSDYEEYLYVVGFYAEGLGPRLTVYDTCSRIKKLLYDGQPEAFNGANIEAITK